MVMFILLLLPMVSLGAGCVGGTDGVVGVAGTKMAKSVTSAMVISDELP